MRPSLILDSQNVYRAPTLSSLAWLEHGFGTRLSSGWLGQRSLTSVRQIHSDRVVIAENESGQIGEGDALLTNQRGMLIAIRTADCLPILIADPERRAVAAIHAGWRGTVANICSKSVQAMERTFGSKRNDLIAAIGPGIAKCCFQVGSEVALQFQPLLPDQKDLGERAYIDLEDLNYRQLSEAGLSDERIVKSGLCTQCNGEMFHSFRRDREEAGRSIAAIGVRL